MRSPSPDPVVPNRLPTKPVTWLASAALAAAFLLFGLIGASPAAASSGPCEATDLETLKTDKGDYAPEETVQVTGTGYAPSCDVAIRITRPNGSIVKGDGSFAPGIDTVTTDELGNLDYAYILNGITGKYLVEALGADEVVLASTIFNDTVITNLEGSGDWSPAGTGSTCDNPNNAISDNNARALCDFGESVVGRDFGLQAPGAIPAGASDIGFTVIVRGRVSNVDGQDRFDVSLSHDGGNTYTAVQTTSEVDKSFSETDDEDFAPNNASTTTCSDQSNFGRTWSYSEISDANFRVKVTAHPRTGAPADAPAEDMDIDDVDLVACYGARTITDAHGGAASPLGNVGASLTVDHTAGNDVLDGSGSPSDEWLSTSYQIEGQAPVCVNTPDNTNNTIDTESFLIPVPATEGFYDLTLIAYSDNSCLQRPSAPRVITDGIKVGIFGDSFGIGAPSAVPGWTEAGGDNQDDCVVGQTGNSDLAGYSHLRLRHGCGVTKTSISTVGRSNVHLRYLWGQSTDNDVTDDGDLIVQWKPSALPDVALNWTTVNTHDLANSTTTDPTANSVDAALGSGAANTSIDLRFIGSTPENNDQARVDDVLVTGDVADVTDPTINVTLNPASPNGSNGFYTSQPTVHVSASDQNLDTVTCKVDGGTSFTPADTDPDANEFEADVPVSGQGQHTVECTATDEAGNDATDSETYKLDSVDPAIDVTLSPASPNGSGGFYTSQPTVHVSASDTNLNDGVSCTFDGNPVTLTDTAAGAGQFESDVPASGQGSHTAACTATDQAGNDATDSETYKLDSVDPTVDVTLDPSTPDGSGGAYANQPDVHVSAFDDQLDTVTCEVDGSAVTLIDTDPDPDKFEADIVVTGSGSHTVNCTAVDQGGNNAGESQSYQVQSPSPNIPGPDEPGPAEPGPDDPGPDEPGPQDPKPNEPEPTTAQCGETKATKVGSGGDEKIRGTREEDVIAGRGGDDQIDGMQSNDMLCGEDGNDGISGAEGDDQIWAGAHTDEAEGNSGDDEIYGGRGQDILLAGSGDDQVSSCSTGNASDVEGLGNDTINGGTGNDLLCGMRGRDKVEGGSGDDEIDGGTGGDRIDLGSGNNEASGGGGNDVIDARNGSRDEIDCGGGRDDVAADPEDWLANDCEH